MYKTAGDTDDVGESSEEKDFGICPEVIRTQLKVGLHGVTCEFRKNGAVIPRQRSDRSA